MKTLLLGTTGLIALVAISTSTSAADLAARPHARVAPVVAAMHDWTGLYIGINGGWGQSHDTRSVDGIGTSGNYDTNGGTFGGQLGYRWQTGSWVFGLEAQGNWADISGSTGNLLVPGSVVGSKMGAFGLFTGQVGYAWNNVLLYVKGGAAITDRNYQFLAPGGALAAQTGSDSRVSATAGAGFEFALARNWSIGIEYNHIFEDSHSATFIIPARGPSAAGFTTGGGVSVAGFRTGGDTDLVLGRLSYKFGGVL